MKSIAVAVLVLGALAACTQKPVEQAPVAAAYPTPTPTPPSFIPYCGQVWSVARQGYVNMTCPAGTNYDGAR